jgi:NTP pyrophosphatase (non-canonical NTP hydrolase)
VEEKMNFEKYKELVRKTRIDLGEDLLDYTVLGLSGEIGEVLNKYKKVLRKDYKLEDIKSNLIDELGDVLWYFTSLCDQLDVDVKTIMSINTIKLLNRIEDNKIKGSGDDR